MNFHYLDVENHVRYKNILSNYVNSKVDEIKITMDDWNKDLAFLNFLKVFYDTTTMCYFVYIPTSCISLRYIYNISV